MISPALPSFIAESGSSKMESDISVSGKGKNAGSKEKPFSGLLQSKQGEKQSGQGIEKQGTTDQVKPEKPSANNREQGKLGHATAKKAATNTEHDSSGEKESISEGKITVQNASLGKVIPVPDKSVSKLPENGKGHAEKNSRGEDLGLKQPGKNKLTITAGQQPPTPSGTQSQVEDAAVVTGSNAKLKQSNSSTNRSATVTGQNVILNRQPTKPVSRDLQNHVESLKSTISERVLNRSASFVQEQGKSEVRGGKLNLPETTSTPARNVSLTKLSEPKAVLKQPVPIVREQNDSNARVGKSKQPATAASAKKIEFQKITTPEGDLKQLASTTRERNVSDPRVDKAVRIVNKSGAKNVHSLVQPDQDDNLKRPITKSGNRQTAAEVHLENDRQPAKSTESNINLNRSVPVAKSHNKPVIESGRVENSANLPVKNGEQKNSKIQKDVGKQKSGVGETSSSLGIESAPSLSKKPSSGVSVQLLKTDRGAKSAGEVQRPLSSGPGDVQLSQIVNRMAKPSDSAEHFNTKSNSNLQIPVKGHLSSKVKSSAKLDVATNSTPGSVVGGKSYSSNPNLGTVVKVLENSRTNVDKVPVEKTSLVGSKLQQEAVEFGKKLEELPVDGKRARTQNSNISGQNVPVNAESTRTTANRTQVIASQLVGASKIIKTIPTKRTVSKQVGLAKRVVKQEQMAKRPNGQQFSNALGQAKPEFSGMEAALKGGDMMLAQEAELNGNSQKQNLFFGDRSSSHQPTEKSINVHSDSAKVVQAEPQPSRDVPVRSDWVNRLAQAGADLESVQGKLTQGRGQTVSTAVMYREIMSTVETFRAMTNNRWSMNLEPIENLRMQLDLRMADSQLVVQARVDRAGHAFLQSGWGELQQLLADKEVDLKSLTTQSQKDGGGAKFENQGGRQSGEQKEKDESWLSRELAELIADFEKESQQPRKAMRTNLKPRMAEATFESWA